MSHARFILTTVLVATGFALGSPSASAQTDLPKQNYMVVQAVKTYRDDRGISPDKLPEARKTFATFAAYYADVIKHPAVWKASLDPKFDPLTSAIPTIDGPNGILRDLDRFLLEPVIGGNKVGADQADYIRELGAALDEALKKLITTDPERIVRINAARVLAHVSRTGAPAHFVTLASLISNANTPTEVKYYLFRAAGEALTAGDPYDIKVRKHANDPKLVGALIKAINNAITTPSQLLVGLPAKPEEITPDQLAVIGLVRRQAVRALAQVKFATYPDPDGKTLYPAYTLVRVAMSDPALNPAPGPAEAAEAAIGICNMAPMVEQLRGGFLPEKRYNADVAVEAVYTAMVNFAGPRAKNPFDRTLPWRAYAARVAQALRDWRPLFDPAFTPSQPARFEARFVPPQVEELYKDVVPRILAKMDTTNGPRVEIEWLRKRLDEVKTRQNRKTELFQGVPETSIEFKAPTPTPPPPPKK